MKVDRDALVATVSRMKSEGFDYLVKVTAVDYADHIDVLYILRNTDTSKDEILEVMLDPEDLRIHTIINIHKSADWYEREMSEMFGIGILGRNAPRLLLEKWDGVDPPLRKVFAWNAAYKTKEDK
ncbi:MAG: NADH-quinone oxidoreductase subunit C [Candidatus Marsarchaeota archaeon]|nr:NADH-quinone oxidoreductase subunit C [Candidatus Marsarchaeota archaeon]MCL5412855.1 NADH-quinone oxidoreductase subunit C [Candidatus Marsarchaeota archaeon]